MRPNAARQRTDYYDVITLDVGRGRLLRFPEIKEPRYEKLALVFAACRLLLGNFGFWVARYGAGYFQGLEVGCTAILLRGRKSGTLARATFHVPDFYVFVVRIDDLADRRWHRGRLNSQRWVVISASLRRDPFLTQWFASAPNPGPSSSPAFRSLPSPWRSGATTPTAARPSRSWRPRTQKLWHFRWLTADGTAALRLNTIYRRARLVWPRGSRASPQRPPVRIRVIPGSGGGGASADQRADVVRPRYPREPVIEDI